MIRTFSAYTNEIDDVDIAVSEIIERLDCDGELLASTVGIVSCFPEFIDSGVVAALGKRLPFATVGLTTSAGSACGEIGEDMLSVLVLTSDDVEFVTALTDPIDGEDPEPLRRAWEASVAGRSDAPALMLSFAPLLFNVTGDFFVETMDAISGGVPNFGSIAVDHTPDYSEARVLTDGDSWRDRYAFVLLYGDISPSFYIGTISDENIFPDKGVVTAAKGNHVEAVNGVPMVDYLLSLGLSRGTGDSQISGVDAFPIIIDYNDGTKPVMRSIFKVTPEGHAACAGRVPVGATLGIGRFDAHEIAATAAGTMHSALSGGEFSTMLIFSCVGRYLALAYERFAEMESVVAGTMAAGVEYIASYSGGEICPVYKKDGATANRSHNNTFIVCAF